VILEDSYNEKNEKIEK